MYVSAQYNVFFSFFNKGKPSLVRKENAIQKVRLVAQNLKLIEKCQTVSNPNKKEFW